MAQGRDCGFEARRGPWAQSDLQRVTGYGPYKLILWGNALGTAEVKSAKSAVPEDLQSVLASLTLTPGDGNMLMMAIRFGNAQVIRI